MKAKGYVATILGASLVSMFMGGCASSMSNVQTASSGRIGCGPSEVVITNLEGGLMSKSWTAECLGKSYFCSGTLSDPWTLTDVSCTKK